MPRQYIVNSWVGAAEYDEGDTYSGEHVGNRNQKSVGVHITRSGDQWYANTSAYAQDDKPTKPQKKKIPIASRIIPAQSTLNRLDIQQKELDEAYENSEISLEEYEELLYVLEGKRDRAHKSLCKALGKSADTEEVGQHRADTEHASGGLESYRKQGVSSVSGSVPKGSPKGYVKSLKNDCIYLLTGSVIGLSILLTLTNT